MSLYQRQEQSPIVIILIFTLLIFVLVYLYRQTHWYTEEEEISEPVYIEKPYV